MGGDHYRRGMYTHFWRSAPYPALIVFDAPDAMSACTRRNRSNTPSQALTLLNDQAFFEFAQGLAIRVLHEAPPIDSERVGHAFRLCLAREPDAAERRRLLQMLARQRASLGASPDDVKSLVAANAPAGTDVRNLAAWTLVARVLLNLDEFVTRE